MVTNKQNVIRVMRIKIEFSIMENAFVKRDFYRKFRIRTLIQIAFKLTPQAIKMIHQAVETFRI